MTDKQIEQKRKAGKMRAQAFTHDYQSRTAKALAARTDMAALGYRGYVSSVGKYGYRGWMEKSRVKRLAHPTDLEQRVASILDRIGVPYDREFVVLTDTERPLVVDFAVFPGPRLIEVHGRPHTVPALNHGNPDGRQVRDEARFRRLREAGYRVCVIDHRLIDRAEEDLRAFLAM